MSEKEDIDKPEDEIGKRILRKNRKKSYEEFFPHRPRSKSEHRDKPEREEYQQTHDDINTGSGRIVHKCRTTDVQDLNLQTLSKSINSKVAEQLVKTNESESFHKNRIQAREAIQTKPSQFRLSTITESPIASTSKNIFSPENTVENKESVREDDFEQIHDNILIHESVHIDKNIFDLDINTENPLIEGVSSDLTNEIEEVSVPLLNSSSDENNRVTKLQGSIQTENEDGQFQSVAQTNKSEEFIEEVIKAPIRDEEPNNQLVLWTPGNQFQPSQSSTCVSRPRILKQSTQTVARKLQFNTFPIEISRINLTPNITSNIGLENIIDIFSQSGSISQTFHSILQQNQTTLHSLSSLRGQKNQNNIIEEIPNRQLKVIMALTPTQYVDLIPKCHDEKSVEQFISIVDSLFASLPDDNAQKTLFLAIVKSKILGKAFNAIKGKSQDSWENIKTNLVAGLEDTVDPAMASNKLVQIRQKKEESLKDYIARIRDALAELDKVSIRDNNNEEVKKHVLRLNDATARSTFELGLWNK